ncbi:MAG: RNA polymerase factor sigma-54 [Synergistaceae bacterium]|nr:RNA polymerase factor sigma-54 [Synergistaceae bacterium]
MKLDCFVVQEQKQILSQCVVESLRILTMDTHELMAFMVREQDENPLVNFAAAGRRHEFLIAGRDELRDIPAANEETVQEFLLSQLRLENYTQDEVKAFRILTESIDERGFLTSPVEELSEIFQIPLSVLHSCRGVLQTLEPVGVGSASVEECLLRQLDTVGCDDDVLRAIITCHLSDVAKGKIGTITRALKVDAGRVRRCINTLRTLSPKPLNGLPGRPDPYVIPDILLSHENGFWTVELNDKWFERFEVCDYYEKLACETQDEELKEYLKQKSQRFHFLNDAIKKRHNTLLRIGQSLAVHHSRFFLRGGSFEPLTMTKLADELMMHPSTVSRAVKNKYLQYPGGVCEMRSLFASGISSSNFPSNSSCGASVETSREEIKTRIRELIDGENRAKPYSDQYLTLLLAEQGIKISRRAVAKYREEMFVGDMYDRRYA